MDDAGLVSSGERVGDLDAVVERLIEWQLRTSQSRRKRLPVQEFHDEEIRPVLMADVVERADVRVRQRRDGAGLALKPLAGGRVVGQVRREHLDRDGAVQARISRAVDLPHAAGAGGADDFVRAEPDTRAEGHEDLADTIIRIRAVAPATGEQTRHTPFLREPFSGAFWVGRVRGFESHPLSHR